MKQLLWKPLGGWSTGCLRASCGLSPFPASSNMVPDASYSGLAQGVFGNHSPLSRFEAEPVSPACKGVSPACKGVGCLPAELPQLTDTLSPPILSGTGSRIPPATGSKRHACSAAPWRHLFPLRTDEFGLLGSSWQGSAPSFSFSHSQRVGTSTLIPDRRFREENLHEL